MSASGKEIRRVGNEDEDAEMGSRAQDFPRIDVKIADRLIPEMRHGGAEGRALKTLRRYRDDPTDDRAAVALATLRILDEDRLIALRQRAQI